VLENTSLAADLTRLADLRVQPLALAVPWKGFFGFRAFFSDGHASTA
jgi:hypothetical protein